MTCRKKKEFVFININEIFMHIVIMLNFLGNIRQIQIVVASRNAFIIYVL